MANTFAFAESRGGELRSVAAETVTAARRIADATGGGEVHVLAIGAPGLAAKAAALRQYGADVITVVEHAGLERYSPEVVAATAAARIKAADYRAAFFPASAEGRDLAPRVAAALDRSLA
jgi:electron transfer flavoprotein alpha subunit